MTDDALAALVLPWAKERHPEKYAETLKVAARPMTFRRYLTRLVEIRCAEDKGFVLSLPVSVLEETALVVRARDRKTGKVYEFKGRLAGPREHAISELALDPDVFDFMLLVQETLDLEYVEQTTSDQRTVDAELVDILDDTGGGGDDGRT